MSKGAGRMSVEVPAVERLRATPILVTASAVQLLGIALFLINTPAQNIPPVLGWLSAMASTGVATVACWGTGWTGGMSRVAKGLWRQVSVVTALGVGGGGGAARQSFVDPVGYTGLSHDLPSTLMYIASMVVLLY